MAGSRPAEGLVQKLRLPRRRRSASWGPKREGRPAGRLPTGSCQKAVRPCRVAGGSEESLWVVAGVVFPERPHAFYDLALGERSGIGFVVGSLKRCFVEGIDLVFFLLASSVAEGLVADVF